MMITTDEYFCVGTEEEVKNFQRKLDFGTDEIKGYYDKLIPEYKKCVFDLLKALGSDKDILGYNLKRFLEAYREEEISQSFISRQLTEDVDHFLSMEQMQPFYNDDKGAEEINKQLDAGKSTRELKDKESELYKYIQTICDYFLTDMEVLENGIGKISMLKDEWLDRFTKDEEFHKIANEEIEDTWNTRLRIEFYENYLREKDELSIDESVLETNWCVMTYYGIFEWLKKHHKENEVNAVRGLIKNLFALQLTRGECPFEIEE